MIRGGFLSMNPSSLLDGIIHLNFGKALLDQIMLAGCLYLKSIQYGNSVQTMIKLRNYILEDNLLFLQCQSKNVLVEIVYWCLVEVEFNPQTQTPLVLVYLSSWCPVLSPSAEVVRKAMNMKMLQSVQDGEVPCKCNTHSHPLFYFFMIRST